MIVRHLDQVVGTERDVEGPSFRSRRLLLARDGASFSFHDTVLHAGSVTTMWYRHHVEAVYCVEGAGSLENLETGEAHAVGPGTFYCLDGHERHRLKADTDLRMMCVFTPPLTGDEVHDDDGAYPLRAHPLPATPQPDDDRPSRPSEAHA
jgi:L-ectoine synthase